MARCLPSARGGCAALLLAFLLLSGFTAAAKIPAAPVLTLYRFNGDREVPYYSVDEFVRHGTRRRAGTLAQGSSVIPCLVIRNGRPLTDARGTPYVGFEVVVDARKATRATTDAFNEAVTRQAGRTVENHHCPSGVRHVISVRSLYPLEKEPFFDPAPPKKRPRLPKRPKTLDAIVRAFHNSPQCAKANRSLVGRRASLLEAWEQFVAEHARRWSATKLSQAMQLDIVLRTALFEGHLERGCSAYGACERNIVALSIRNRARGACRRKQGCRYEGDFVGVATEISQYNIWDEFLTQISGLTACFLREDLSDPPPLAEGEQYDFNAVYYRKLRRMYEQNAVDVERILFGDAKALRAVFPKNAMGDLAHLRHYYHPPAMGKCFPQFKRIEYISGAAAQKRKDYALIANTRIQVGQKVGGGYRFKSFELDAQPDRDVVAIADDYPGFVIDRRKVSLRSPRRCVPYGVPRGCRFKRVERYRRTPHWIRAGKPLAVSCRVAERGAECTEKARYTIEQVGGRCDTEMQPFSGVR